MSIITEDVSTHGIRRESIFIMFIDHLAMFVAIARSKITNWWWH